MNRWKINVLFKLKKKKDQGTIGKVFLWKDVSSIPVVFSFADGADGAVGGTRVSRQCD